MPEFQEVADSAAGLAPPRPVDASIPRMRGPAAPLASVKPLGPRVDLTSDGGVFKRVKTAGDAQRPRPALGDRVTIHYVAMQGADGVLFDSSRKQMHAGGYAYTVGSTDSIKPGMPRPRGWDIAIMSMDVGECALITLAPEYAYGKAGIRQPPRPGYTVPPHVSVTYNIELVDVGTAKENMTPREKLDKGIALCGKGNGFFQDKAFAKARAQYELALEVLQTFPGVRHDMPPDDDDNRGDNNNKNKNTKKKKKKGTTDGNDDDDESEEEEERLGDRCLAKDEATPHALEARGAIVRCLSNIAMCLTVITPVDWKAVRKNCDQALWVHDEGGLHDAKLAGKVLYRRAEACLQKGESESARADLVRAYKLLPDSKPIRKMLRKVQEQVRDERGKRKEMFGNLMLSGKANGMYSDKKDVELREDATGGAELAGSAWFDALETFINGNKVLFVSVCAAVVFSAMYAKAMGLLGDR